MKAVSDEFIAALRAPHTLVTEVRVVTTGERIPIDGGSVTLNGGTGVRTRATLQVPGDELIPRLPADTLNPYGTELEIVQTIPGAGSVTLGIVGIDETSITETDGAATVTVECYDRALKISKAQIERTYQVVADTPVDDLIERLLTDAMPEIEFDFDELPHLIPAIVVEAQADPWAEAQKHALEAGGRLYFDQHGKARLIGTRVDHPVADYVEGEGGLLIKPSRKLGTENLYNRWIVTSDNPDSSVRGVATDDNPASPTFYHGPIGHRPRFYEAEGIATNDQAMIAAEELREREIGLREIVEFDGISNPALEPDDNIRVARPKLGIDSIYTIDELTIPLGPTGVMSARCRERVIE